MSKSNSSKTSTTPGEVSCDVTRQQAFDCYRRLETPTPAVVAEHFRKLGRNLSRSQVEEWVREGDWQSRIDLASAAFITNPETVLGDLTKLAQEPTDKIMQGLAHRIMVRLGDRIGQPSIGNVQDFARLCDLAIELVKACARAGANGAANPTAPSSPTITLGEFKQAKR